MVEKKAVMMPVSDRKKMIDRVGENLTIEQ